MRTRFMRWSMLAMWVLVLAACHSVQTVTPADGGTVVDAVHVGQTVEITTKDGRQHRFTVTRVDVDAIAGDGIEVATDDIARMQVRTLSKGRTIGAGVGGSVLLYLILSAAAAALILGSAGG